GEREQRFRAELMRAVAQDSGVSDSVAAERIVPLVERSRELGFQSEREVAAFVLAVLLLGEERLVQTDAFAMAAFDVNANAAQRAERLAAARMEALAAGT